MTAIVPVQGPGTAVAAPAAPRVLRPIAKPSELLAAQNETRGAVKELLVETRDYGMIPGVKKPSLFQPGAERINLAFGVVARYRIVEKEIDHDRENQYETRGRTAVSFGLYRYVVECELVLRDSNEVVGTGLASCSSLESKYVSRPRDSENTVLQMAEKRAFVRATRTAYGLSDEFTQDVEDTPAAREEERPDDRQAQSTQPAQAPAPKVPTTLEEAKAFPFPYERSKGAEGNYGKPLETLKIGFLKRAAMWAVEQGRQQQDAAFLAAVGILSAELERVAEVEQPRLPLDGAASSPTSTAATPAPSPGTPTEKDGATTQPPTATADPTSRYAVGKDLAQLVKDERIPKSSRAAAESVLHNPNATLEQLTRQRDRLKERLKLDAVVSQTSDVGPVDEEPTRDPADDDLPF